MAAFKIGGAFHPNVHEHKFFLMDRTFNMSGCFPFLRLGAKKGHAFRSSSLQERHSSAYAAQ